MKEGFICAVIIVGVIALSAGFTLWTESHEPHYRVELINDGKVTRQWECKGMPRHLGDGPFNAPVGFSFRDIATGELVAIRADSGTIVITEIKP